MPDPALSPSPDISATSGNAHSDADLRVPMRPAANDHAAASANGAAQDTGPTVAPGGTTSYSPYVATADTPRPPALEPRLAATASIADPHLRQLVTANVRLQTQREIQGFTDQQRSLKAQAKEVIDQGGDLSAIPTKLLLQIDAGGRQALQDYALAHANPRTDPGIYYHLKNQALDDAAGFQAIDLSDQMARLNPKDYAELQQLQNNLRNGQPPADLPLQQVYKANTDRLLQQLGLPASTSSSGNVASAAGAPDQQVALQQATYLRQTVDQGLAAHQVIHGRPATPAEQQQILDQAVMNRYLGSRQSADWPSGNGSFSGVSTGWATNPSRQASTHLPQPEATDRSRVSDAMPGGTATPGAAAGGATQLAADTPPDSQPPSPATTPTRQTAPAVQGPAEPAPAAPAQPQAPAPSSAPADAPTEPADEAGDWKAKVWPVPGNFDLNKADSLRSQGDGTFHSRGGEHQGVDIHAAEGSPVVAVSDGVIVRADDSDKGGYGNQVIIDHGNGVFTQYAHMNAQIDKDADGKTVMTFVGPGGKIVQLKVGQKIKAGDQIGIIGRTGNVPEKADSHLHFEIRHGGPAAHKVGGHVVDPMRHLPR